MVEELRSGELKINTAYNKLMMATKVVKTIDVSGGVEDEYGVGAFCKIDGQVEKIERVYRILELAGGYRGIEARKCLEKQGVFLQKLFCS